MALMLGLGVVLTSTEIWADAVDEVIKVVDVQIIDTPSSGGSAVWTELYANNNGDGVADPGEWLGFEMVLWIAPPVPADARVRVSFDESFETQGYNRTRQRFEISDIGNDQYLLDMSGDDDRRWLAWLRGKSAATVDLGLVSGLTTLGSTTYEMKIREGDLIPPVVDYMAVMSTLEPPTLVQGQLELGQTIVFGVWVIEAATVSHVQGRVLRLPEADEAALVQFDLWEPPGGVRSVGSFVYVGTWTVDRGGTFQLEVTVDDESGHRVTTSSDTHGGEARVTTARFEPGGSDVLFYGRPSAPPGSVFRDDEYIEALERNGISFDLWDVAVRGAGREIWWLYGAGQVVMLSASQLGDTGAAAAVEEFQETGGRMLVVDGFLFLDGAVSNLEHGAILERNLHARLMRNATEMQEEGRALLFATEDDRVFGDLEVVIDDGLPSRIVVDSDLRGAIVTPLLRDAVGGVQAIAVVDRGAILYLNFDPAKVSDLRVREELLLRSLEYLLGYPLQRAQLTTVADDGGVAERFLVEQNYPNPFNTTTVIRYRLAKEGRVRMSIYDIAGQEIERVVDSVEGPGIHEVRWNGGRRASGTYLYRLETGWSVGVKRMVLVR